MAAPVLFTVSIDYCRLADSLGAAPLAPEVQKVEADFNSSFFNEDNLQEWGSLLLP